MVHFNIGPSRWDAAGYDIRCMPHLALGTSPTKSERYFTSGNERSPFDFNPGGVNLSSGSGYQLRQTDKFGYLIELMNMNMEDQIVYLTMVYDYLEGPLPKGWTEIKVIWLDANQCGSSEITPWQETGTFRLESEPPWSPNFEGKIVSAIGHLHDGGVQIDIRFSANNSLCKSATVYSESPEYIYRGTSMGDDKVAKDHISSMSGCKPSDLSIRELKKDQAWFVGGNYDYDKRQGNLERGVQADVSIHIYFISSYRFLSFDS
jgi:hypothetical protein